MTTPPLSPLTAEERASAQRLAEGSQPSLLRDLTLRLLAQVEALDGVRKLAGVTLDEDGSISFNMAKYNRAHRCEAHTERNPAFEGCMQCLDERNLALSKENATLRARVEELERDRERLDWLEQMNPGWNWSVDCDRSGADLNCCSNGLPLREAIDAARARDTEAR